MKRSMADLAASLRRGLSSLGYAEWLDSNEDAPRRYAKALGGHWFLTLGLAFSDERGAHFSGAFHVSKSTRWGAVWGDIPTDSHERVEVRLSAKEREVLLDSSADGWWDANDEASLQRFVVAVGLAEPRFVGQRELMLRVAASVEVRELEECARQVTARASRGFVVDDYPYRFTPGRAVDGVGREWFRAAERVLAVRGVTNSKTVSALAVDAWWQCQLLRAKSLPREGSASRGVALASVA